MKERHSCTIDIIRILGIGLEVARNGSSCQGISLQRDKCHLHLNGFSALALVAS